MSENIDKLNAHLDMQKIILEEILKAADEDTRNKIKGRITQAIFDKSSTSYSSQAKTYLDLIENQTTS